MHRVLALPNGLLLADLAGRRLVNLEIKCAIRAASQCPCALWTCKTKGEVMARTRAL